MLLLNTEPVASSKIPDRLPTRKLLIVAFHAPSQAEGETVRIIKLAQSLTRLGWDITILTNQEQPGNFFRSELPSNVQIVFKSQWGKAHWLQNLLPWSVNGLLSLLLQPQKTEAILTASTASLAHLLGVIVKFQNPQANWLMKNCSLNSSTSQQSSSGFWNNLQERWIFQQANFVGVLNETMRTKYVRIFPLVLKSKLVVLPNGLEKDQMGALSSEQEAIDPYSNEEIASKVHRLLSRKPSRPKIYHLHGRQKSLIPNKGDKINQISFMMALSKFADVYYNGQLFIPDAPDYGLKEKKVKQPKGHYDLYIVRNNADIFNACPHPKVWIGSLYDKLAFEKADAVLTLTDSWKERLEQLYLPGVDRGQAVETLFNNFFPPDMIEPRHIINIKQVVSPHFFDAPDEERIAHYTGLMGNGFTVAFFGRINSLSYPYAFMRCLPELEKAIEGLTVVFAGQIQDMTLEYAAKTGYVPPEFDKIDLSKVVNPPEIPFEQMPSATRACKILLANEQPEGSWAGSVKPLEAMACGIPFLTTRRPVRLEQLGAAYPLYYETDQELISHVIRLANEPGFYQEVKNYLLTRARQFTVDKMAEYLEDQLSPFMRNSLIKK